MLYTTVYLIVMICKSDHQTQHIHVCWSVVEMQELSIMQSRHRGTLATVTLCSSQFPQTSEPRLVFSVVTAHIIHQCQCLVRARLQHYSNTALDQHMPPGQCALCAKVTQTTWSQNPAMFAADEKWICETLFSWSLTTCLAGGGGTGQRWHWGSAQVAGCWADVWLRRDGGDSVAGGGDQWSPWCWPHSANTADRWSAQTQPPSGSTRYP